MGRSAVYDEGKPMSIDWHDDNGGYMDLYLDGEPTPGWVKKRANNDGTVDCYGYNEFFTHPDRETAEAWVIAECILGESL